jgi:hypothetical protein
MKPSTRSRHFAWPGHAVSRANAASLLVLALLLPLPCLQAAETAAVPATMANAGALNVTPPATMEALEQADRQVAAESETQVGTAAGTHGAPAASVFEDVLREQDPAEVPLSLALMGGVLGMLYIRRRKR